MNRISPFLIIAGSLGMGCQPTDHTEQLAALARRVETLEQKLESRPTARRPRRPDPQQTYYLPVSADDPYRGAEHAKVTIVEVYEFACPYCALIEPMLADLLKKYEGTDTVKVVSKQFLVHPQLATDAALATCAAHAQGRFAAYAEILWTKSWKTEGGRPRIQRDQLKKPELIALASTIGLDVERFKRDLDGSACKDKVRRDRTELARIGVRGTPYLFVNGRYYTGPRSVEALQRAVETEVKKVDRALGNGTKLAEYYGTLMKSARRKL